MNFACFICGPSATMILVLFVLLVAALPRQCVAVIYQVTDGFSHDGQIHNNENVAFILRGLDGTRAVTSVVSVSNVVINECTMNIYGYEGETIPDTFVTSVHMTIYKLHITGKWSDVNELAFHYLPPNAYIHVLQTTADRHGLWGCIILQTAWHYNSTVFIEDSDFSMVGYALYVFLHSISTQQYGFEDNCVVHVKKMKITGGRGLFYVYDTVPLLIKKQSTIVFEDVHCINVTEAVLFPKTIVLSNHSALIVRNVINERTTDNTVMPFLKATTITVDETSVMSFVDIDTSNGFKARTSGAIKIVEINGAGTIVFSRWLMQKSGLGKLQPSDNRNFWVSARTNATTDLSPKKLRVDHYFNVNMDNTYNWNGTGADGTTCVPVGGGIPDRATYKLVDGKCTATCKMGFVPPACRAPEKTSQCRVDNCDLCYRVTKTKCMLCAEHTTIENNDQVCRCPASLENCQVCPSESTCTKCVDGYNLTRDGSKCISCTVPNCGHCDGPNTCDQCAPQYSVSVDKKECHSCKVANCAHCSGHDVCEQCVPHYNLSSTGQHRCIPCSVANCVECKGEGTCAKCIDGYSVPQGGTECISCPIAHCERCDAEGVCAVCADQHTSVDGKHCHSCTMPGCLKCDGKEQCMECDGKYTLVGKTCVACDVPNCKSCLGDGTCAECNPPFQVQGGGKAGKTTCVHCDVPNCATCLADDVCHECAPHYSLGIADNRCIPCGIDGCAACDSDSHCSACANGNPPVDDGQKCVSCEVSGCMYCNATDSCAECKDRYSIAAVDAAGKLTCTSCNIDHCLFCGASGTCLECEAFYNASKSGPRCNSCLMSNCQRCDEDGVCAQCDTTLSVSLNGGECTPCDIGNCTYCAQAGACGKCACGMVPTSDGKKCVPCTAANCKHCELPGDGTKCAECADGYDVAGDGSCRKSGVPSWVVFLIVLAVTIIVAVSVILGVVFHRRYQAELLRDELDAEERRRNRQSTCPGTRHHTEIGILDLRELEGAASGVRDYFKTIQNDVSL